MTATFQQERLLRPPREPNWCPATHCARSCGAGDCRCPPCHCANCKARARRARRGRPLPYTPLDLFRAPPPTRLFIP
jgi:hypothetical protein